MASLQAFLSFLPRAPKFSLPLPLPLLTPATQARLQAVYYVIHNKTLQTGSNV